MLFVKNERALTTTHAVLGKLETEVETVVFQSEEEARTFFGGSEGLLAHINSGAKTESMNEGRVTLRDFEVPEGSTEADYPRLRNEAKAAARDTVRNYSGTRTARGPSVKRRVEGQKIAEKIVGSGLDFDREEMKEALAGQIPARFAHLFTE